MVMDLGFYGFTFVFGSSEDSGKITNMFCSRIYGSLYIPRPSLDKFAFKNCQLWK